MWVHCDITLVWFRKEDDDDHFQPSKGLFHVIGFGVPRSGNEKDERNTVYSDFSLNQVTSNRTQMFLLVPTRAFHRIFLVFSLPRLKWLLRIFLNDDAFISRDLVNAGTLVLLYDNVQNIDLNLYFNYYIYKYIYIYIINEVLYIIYRRLRGRRAYLGARMKNDVSRRADEERRISPRG